MEFSMKIQFSHVLFCIQNISNNENKTSEKSLIEWCNWRDDNVKTVNVGFVWTSQKKLV